MQRRLFVGVKDVSSMLDKLTCQRRSYKPSPPPGLVDRYALMYLRAILDWFFQVRIDWEFLESCFLNLAKNQDLEVGFRNYWSCSINLVYDLKIVFL